MYPVVVMKNRHRMIRVSALALRYLANSNLLAHVWVSRYGTVKDIHCIDVVAATNDKKVLPWDSTVLTAFDLGIGKDWYWYLTWDEIAKLQTVMLPSGRKIVEN